MKATPQIIIDLMVIIFTICYIVDPRETRLFLIYKLFGAILVLQD